MASRQDPGIPFTISAHDTSNFSHTTRGIAFATAGTIVAVTAAGATVTIPGSALAAGIIHPLVLRRINATGTSATAFIGFY